MEDDIGSKVIGDTHTHVDFPYRCKRCGQYVKIEDRFRWKHNCVPKRWYGVFNFGRGIEVSRGPIRETYAKGYKHRIVNKQSIFIRFVFWLKSLFKIK